MSLERIEITPFTVIAGDILQHRKTGYLTIFKPPLRKTTYWSQGELVMAASTAPEDSLADFLVRRGAVTVDRAAQLFGDDPNDAVARVHELGLLDLSSRQALLREWLTAVFVPLFSLDEGTATFTDDEPLPPEKRVFLQSTAAVMIDGIRSITNGLVLRRSLGDLKRLIQPARDSRFNVESLPINEQERSIAAALQEATPIEVFLKRFSTQSVAAAKVVIAMLAIGVYTTVAEQRPTSNAAEMADMQRDLELLAAIGSSDQRSLRAVAFSRQMGALDHYQVLDVPRAATRAQIINAGEELKKKYDPATFPPIVRESVMMIHRRADEAMNVLKDAAQRGSYDKLVQQRAGSDKTIQQRLTQQSIAEQNYAKAKELTSQGDYYGAIVLLKQAVQFVPDHSGAWHLLGACQERNPKWRRDAAESFQKALSIDPNNVDALISLGDLYKLEGLITRAQVCWEDALKIQPENQQAKSRLTGLKKK